jgi:hypothetical protein
VLYSAPLRDLLLELAVADVYRARWSADIHREWMNALLRNKPHSTRAALERTRELMNRAVLDAQVTGYERVLRHVELPDANDRHVLAAAIVGGCDVILTMNVRHFPAEALADHGITAEVPDAFLARALDHAGPSFLASAARVRHRLQKPPVGIDAYLETLAAHGLEATAAKLKAYAKLL